jgi:hypothetical protein
MAVIKKGQMVGNKLPDLEFIPNVGKRTILRREFGDYTTAVAYAASLYSINTRASVRQQGDGPKWMVESSYEGDPDDPNADLVNTHEIRINVLNPDIKANTYLQSRFTAQYGSKAARNIATIEKFANGIKTSSTPESEYNTLISDMATTGTFISDSAALAIQLLNELLLGADTFIDFQYVYTHTFNFGSQQDAIPDHFGVRQIFTPAGVVADENIPAFFGFTAVGGEWFKLPPEITEMYGGRRLLKYEYWWAEQWSTLRYARSGV